MKVIFITNTNNQGTYLQKPLRPLTCEEEHLKQALDVDILQFTVDTKTASEVWGMSDGRIKQLAKDGAIKAKKFGRNWVIDIRQPNPKIYGSIDKKRKEQE